MHALRVRPPTPDEVRAYYDERVEGKIQDFTEANPRIEAAICTVAEWAPPNPRRILEIGCGIGATSWRMARAWPEAEVIGIDVSGTSIRVAETCFRRPNLSYLTGVIGPGLLAGKFDLIVLMDVYEHIAPADRSALHAAIRSLLSDESRVVVTIPTPEILDDARKRAPSELQPIDENIDMEEIVRLAADTATRLLYYRKVGIWSYGDYAHLVLGRIQELARVNGRVSHAGIRSLVTSRLNRLFRRGEWKQDGRRNYLGPDLLARSSRASRARFEVSRDERRRLASSWMARGGRQS